MENIVSDGEEATKRTRLNLLVVCIGAVEAKYGNNCSFEALFEKVSIEFPEKNFTKDELSRALALSIEYEEIKLLYSNIGYG